MVTVDEERLTGIITTLNEEMALVNIKRSTLRDISEVANSIKLLDVPAPTDDNIHATAKVLPIDPKLGTTIDVARREAIYDKLLLDVAALNPDDQSADPVELEE